MLSQAELDDLFCAFGPVRTRPMFGGGGLYADGLMFAIDVDDCIFLKADSRLAEELERRGCRRFAYTARGREVKLNFWSVPEDALDAPEDMARLAHAALACARRAAEEKARSGKARSGKTRSSRPHQPPR